jgi:uncharacterized membrane protein YkvA (DUF1232 family)
MPISLKKAIKLGKMKPVEAIKKYAGAFTEPALWRKLRKFAQSLGLKTVYTILLLYYAYVRKETPAWAKRIVIGALGYLLAPIDAIPDLTPFIGYTDDIGVLSFGLVTIAAYVNDEVKNQARDRLKAWFGHIDEQKLAQVDRQL